MRRPPRTRIPAPGRRSGRSDCRRSRAGSTIEIAVAASLPHGSGHECRVHVLVHTVACEQEGVAPLDVDGVVVDLDLSFAAYRPVEVALTLGQPHAVIIRQLLERIRV